MADIKRQDIDDFGKRNSNKDSYKNRYFDGKRSAIDEYTGERVFYSSKGHYTTKKTANVDHIVPLDQLIKQYGNEISKSDLKRIANADSNLAITNEALNKAKSNATNLKFAFDLTIDGIKKGKPQNLTTAYNMAVKGVSGRTGTVTNIATTKLSNNVSRWTKGKIEIPKNNIAGNMAGAGTEAALIALTISSLTNLAMVACGDKSIDTALQDIAVDSGGSFVSTAGIQGTQEAVNTIYQNYASSATKNLIGSALPTAQIITTIMVTRSVIKYLDGEITEEECAAEIITGSAGMIAFQLGLISNPVGVGAIVVTLVVSQISKTILKYQQEKKIAAKRMAQFNRIVSDALIALEKQKNILADFREKEREKLAKAFNTGFEYIQLSILQNNVDGITDGLNCILSVFNEKCAFQSLDEFNDFFDNEEAVLVL